MLPSLFRMITPYLMKKDPEQSHLLTLKFMRLLGALPLGASTDKKHSFMGLDFPSRLGLAAGFDKNAEAMSGTFKMGFGFTEIGTVTPLPQMGNEQPRLFRLTEDMAVINRMGFNNDGADIISKRLKKWRDKGNKQIVGVNIGANKDSKNRIDDYAKCAEYFLDTASYFTINVSSPNTQNLRDLQKQDSLIPLIEKVINVTQKQKPTPILVKISPDLMQEDLEVIADIINNRPVAGVISTNTTISRPLGLVSEHQKETGGLSGKPLFDLSTAITEMLRSVLLPEKVIIGAGGICNGPSAQHKLEVGADLLQLYSCLVYKGPELVYDIIKQVDSQKN